MLSGFQVSTLPELDFKKFKAFAAAVGCTQDPGPSRLQFLRNVSESTIRAYINGTKISFTPGVDKYVFYSACEESHVMIGVDSVTMFDDPLHRIRTGQIARVPILLGNLEDDGTMFAYLEQKNLSATIAQLIGSSGDQSDLSPTVVRGLYPGSNDPRVIADAWRDVQFRWCVPCLAWIEKNLTNTC